MNQRPERPEWPKRPDGSPKNFGEMTPAERKAQLQGAVNTLQQELAPHGVSITLEDGPPPSTKST